MTDHPRVVHTVAGGGTLRVVVARLDADRVVGANLDDRFTQLRVPIALGRREAIVVQLGLRMVVRRVAGPAAGPGGRCAEMRPAPEAGRLKKAL